ncbi:hypothetical protein ACP26L_13895 [Paenibacillus sp. S-38]|uniref:hypothetical protein n=1 Tax=Paenibacillus sp. S-38 TaxID=3416710 RepID=UPI003CF00F65
MTNIGKPYEGKPHVRFDEEGQKFSALYSRIYISRLIPSSYIPYKRVSSLKDGEAVYLVPVHGCANGFSPRHGTQ